MAHAPRSRPAKRSTNRKAASKALFNPALFLETTANGRVISTHSKKDVIFAQGDDADAKGKVKVAIVSKEGKEAVIALLGPDEFVGEGCLIGQPKRLATASAMTDAKRCE
jgi:CRP/FNR family cyclic AMP-dependent transcriptional regulator